MCCLVARGFQLKREQMYQQSPTVAFAQYANENQVISTQCITRQCSRLAGGKMITLHNDSLLLCIASGKTTLIFCLTCAVFQRMCQSPWKCLLLVANMVDLLSSFSLWEAWNQIMSDMTGGMGFCCTQLSIPLLRRFLPSVIVRLAVWACSCLVKMATVKAGFSLQRLWKWSDFKGIHSPHTVYLPSGWATLITLGFWRCWNCGAY